MSGIDLYCFHEWHQRFLDGLLNEADERAFVLFVERHPHLLDESLLDGSMLEPPIVTFTGKGSLKKEKSEIEGLSSFEYLAVKSIEEGLDGQEAEQLKGLIKERPALENELYLLSKAQLKADTSVLFADKQVLKRVLFWQGALGRVLKLTASAAAIVGILLLVKPVFLFKPDVSKVGMANHNKSAMKSMPMAMADKRVVGRESNVVAVLAEPAIPDEKHGEELIRQVADSRICELEPLVSKTSVVLLPQPALNAYEIGLNVMMPQFLDNLVDQGEWLTVLQEGEKVAPEQPLRENFSVRMVEEGVKLVNVIGGDRLRFSKAYDNEGNIVAYQIKTDGIEWSRQIK